MHFLVNLENHLFTEYSQVTLELACIIQVVPKKKHPKIKDNKGAVSFLHYNQVPFNVPMPRANT